MELGNIRERQAAGIAAAKARGVFDRLEGRPKGSSKAKPERARELKAQGLKNKEIAAALDIHRNTVSRYLKNSAKTYPSRSEDTLQSRIKCKVD